MTPIARDGLVVASLELSDGFTPEVLAWMTHVERIPVSATAPLAANGDDVRVRAHTRPHHAWFFWPWGVTAFGQATFTFIQ